MNPRLRSVFALCWLFLLFGNDKMSSATPLNLMDVDGNLCSSSCYMSIKPIITYFGELKERAERKAEEHVERDKEKKELRQRLLELSDFREQFKAINQQIEELRETNETLRESNQHRNIIEKTKEDIKLKEKDLNECIANRGTLEKEIETERNNRINMEKKYKADMKYLEIEKDRIINELESDFKTKENILNNQIKDLKEEIELERRSRIEIEQKHKINLDNLTKHKDNVINELETKLINETSNYKTKENILNNEIQELKSQVSSYKKQLEETQNQLTNKNILDESNSLKIKTIEKDLGEYKEKFTTSGCQGLSSGIHRIGLPGLDPFTAFCNGDIDGGGWIVMQKRFDGSEDFYRNWTEYREGFGKLGAEFFLGLETLHRITNLERYELYIQMEYFDGKVKFAKHDNFIIGNENEKYELQSIGDFSGTAIEYLFYSLHGKFSTYDRDNDLVHDKHRAKEFRSGWWYSRFVGPNPNGRYYKCGITKEDSMNWDTFESLKSMQMLIRPFQLK